MPSTTKEEQRNEFLADDDIWKAAKCLLITLWLILASGPMLCAWYDSVASPAADCSPKDMSWMMGQGHRAKEVNGQNYWGSGCVSGEGVVTVRSRSGVH